MSVMQIKHALITAYLCYKPDSTALMSYNIAIIIQRLIHKNH